MKERNNKNNNKLINNFKKGTVREETTRKERKKTKKDKKKKKDKQSAAREQSQYFIQFFFSFLFDSTDRSISCNLKNQFRSTFPIRGPLFCTLHKGEVQWKILLSSWGRTHNIFQSPRVEFSKLDICSSFFLSPAVPFSRMTHISIFGFQAMKNVLC